MVISIWDGLSVLSIILLVVTALSAGLAKGGFSGFGMLAAVLMPAVFTDVKESTGILLPMLILADIVAVCIYRYHANFSLVWKILPPALIGIVIGWLIMPHVNGDAFARLFAWLILAMLALVCLRKFFPFAIEAAANHPKFAWLLGTLAGFTSMLSNTGGPVVGIYLIARRVEKMEIVGISAWFFFIVNLAKAPFSIQLGIFTWQGTLLALAHVPVIVAGVFLARWLLRFIPQKIFEWLIISFALIGALRLLVTSG